MTSESIYVISNSNMRMFPDNSRTAFSNKFPKELSVSNEGDNALWVIVENVIFENTMIRYRKKDAVPDIMLTDIPRRKNILFKMPERWFDNNRSLENFLSSEFNRISMQLNGFQDTSQFKTFLGINLKNNYFYLTFTTNVDVCIHSKFYEFLGFKNSGSILGEILYQGNKYYMLGGNTENDTSKCVKADNPFDINIFTPHLVQLKCDNIIPNISGGGYNNVIDSFCVDYSKRVTDFNPRNIKAFKINSKNLSGISISLTDEENTPLGFVIGVPTIVKLKIVEMNQQLNNFYVKVSSTDSKEIFVKNSASSFTTRLPKEISLGKNWMVGLSSIFLPKNIHNIYSPINELVIEEYLDSESASLNRSTDVTLEPGYYRSPLALLDMINRCLSTKTGITIHLDTNGVFYLTAYDINLSKRRIKFNKKLLGVLGVVEELLVRDTSDIIFLTFCYSETLNGHNILTCKDFENINSLTKKTKYCFTSEPNIHFSISPWIFIYSNIVKTSIVGYSKLPLLKIIPISIQNNDRGTFINFDNIEFFSLAIENFQIIHFELRNHDGHPLGIQNEQVLLTLSFKQN